MSEEKKKKYNVKLGGVTLIISMLLIPIIIIIFIGELILLMPFLLSYGFIAVIVTIIGGFLMVGILNIFDFISDIPSKIRKIRLIRLYPKGLTFVKCLNCDELIALKLNRDVFMIYKEHKRGRLIEDKGDHFLIGCYKCGCVHKVRK